MNDKAMMEQVLTLAKKGAATTHPNPRVGCIIVKDGEIVGKGFHQSAGELHAERLALADAGDKARGATAYVSLEPCCHQGRTPPCTDGLIDAGIVKVVSAMTDPNPRVAGSGFEQLKNAGIEVVDGVLEQQARWMNRGFIHRMMQNKPWVQLKSAATLDGRTAAFDGKSKWITGDDARAEVQTIRSHCSAVLTGIGTVLADDPNMNVRFTATENTRDTSVVRQPLRVVLDTHLKIPLDARIIGDDGGLVVFTASDDLDKTAALIERGVEVITVATTDADQINLNAALNELSKWQCNEILVEAGQTLSGAFLQQGLVDELVLFYAGSLLGDQGKSMFQFDRPLEFEKRTEFLIKNVAMVGADIRVDALNQHSAERISLV